MSRDLTKGPVMKSMLLFTWPMLAGNLLQQCYNMADTLIVGKALGTDALSAVGSAFTLMTFLTSILIGLCMGAGSVCAISFGKKDWQGMQTKMRAAAVLIGVTAICLETVSFWALTPILHLMQIPAEIFELTKSYVFVILFGIFFLFLYNYCAYMLRAAGNSYVPLLFLGIGTISNIFMDLLFVMVLGWGVEGAAAATVAAQGISGAGILIYALITEPMFRKMAACPSPDGRILREIAENSFGACLQQSIMNFGILMIQGLVNSFGTIVMAAFAVGVKIDAFAYMPVQEFGNAFSVFIAQNHGAGEKERIRSGVRGAVKISVIFSLAVSCLVVWLAPSLLRLFLQAGEEQVVAVGAKYLRIEGAFYFGIGLLFLLYGYFRAIARPMMSVLLTVISLGTRVVLSYLLAPILGVTVIWCAIPAGWILADLVGYLVYKRQKENSGEDKK
ncbi:MAG: MATE family efflux transporter [Lachnospiraceae bacterium]|nr:MATE family efflux transporter [Lachnospiraceae bacterium]